MVRRKPIDPSDRAMKLAREILRDLCFTSFNENEVKRVARRITQEYETANED